MDIADLAGLPAGGQIVFQRIPLLSPLSEAGLLPVEVLELLSQRFESALGFRLTSTGDGIDPDRQSHHHDDDRRQKSKNDLEPAPPFDDRQGHGRPHSKARIRIWSPAWVSTTLTASVNPSPSSAM